MRRRTFIVGLAALGMATLPSVAHSRPRRGNQAGGNGGSGNGSRGSGNGSRGSGNKPPKGEEKKGEEEGEFPAWGIAAIVVGVLALIGGIAAFAMRKKKPKKPDEVTPGAAAGAAAPANPPPVPVPGLTRRQRFWAAVRYMSDR